MTMKNNEALEVKIAFLEESVATISEEFFSQQKELNELKQQVALLVEKIRTLQNNESTGADFIDEKPPHY